MTVVFSVVLLVVVAVCAVCLVREERADAETARLERMLSATRFRPEREGW